MSEQEITNIFDILTIILLLALFLVIYFLPTIIANFRKHSYKLAIFFLNFFTGLTGFGWVAAFVWAFVDKPVVKLESQPTIAQELKELAQLKEQGIITDKEFETKKNKLLNS